MFSIFLKVAIATSNFMNGVYNSGFSQEFSVSMLKKSYGVKNLKSSNIKTSALNYLAHLPSCYTCLTYLCALRAYVLYVLMWLTYVPACLSAFASYMPYMPSFFYVPYVPSFFLRALRVFIFLRGLIYYVCRCLYFFTCLTCLHSFESVQSYLCLFYEMWNNPKLTTTRQNKQERGRINGK